MKGEIRQILIEMHNKLVGDNRLKSSHVSLYNALLVCWLENNFICPFRIDRASLMRSSKIGSKTTYHHCIWELEKYGYISYSPSYNSHIGSQIALHKLPINGIEEERGRGINT